MREAIEEQQPSDIKTDCPWSNRLKAYQKIGSHFCIGCGPGPSLVNSSEGLCWCHPSKGEGRKKEKGKNDTKVRRYGGEECKGHTGTLAVCTLLSLGWPYWFNTASQGEEARKTK